MGSGGAMTIITIAAILGTIAIAVYFWRLDKGER